MADIRTLAELRSTLRKRATIAENDTSATYQVLDDFINVALQQVSVEHDWPWLLTSEAISTTSGDSTYPLDDRYVATDTIVDLTTGESLRHRDRKTLLLTPTATTGRPTVYSIYAGQINVRPVPNGVYALTHLFYQQEAILIGDTAEPLVPRGYDEGVIEYAAFLALRFMREEQRAVFARKAYDEWLTRTADNLIESKETRAPRVRPGNQV